jgi:hypothetical protein
VSRDWQKIIYSACIALAVPSMALAFERPEGAYYCTVKFSGGVSYNSTFQQWQGVIFSPDGNFVLKLDFIDTVKTPFDGISDERAEYSAIIRKEGDSLSYPCFSKDVPLAANNSDKKSAYLELGKLDCDIQVGLYEVKINFENHRFLKIYKAGYLDGRDNNANTPSISGGICTKIQ